MKKRIKWNKVFAFMLVLCVTVNSTGIAEALVHSGLVEYLGAVGDNIVRYYNAHHAYADDATPTATPQPTPQPPTIICNHPLSVNCPHSGLESGIDAVEEAVGALGAKVGSTQKAVTDLKDALTAASKKNESLHSQTQGAIVTQGAQIGEAIVTQGAQIGSAIITQGATIGGAIGSAASDVKSTIETESGIIKTAIEAFQSENKSSHEAALTQLQAIAGSTGTTAERLLWVYDQLHFKGKPLAQLQSEERDLIENLVNTWFTKSTGYIEGSGEGYTMFALADNVSVTKTILNNSLGYTNKDGSTEVDGESVAPKYIWAETETRTLQGDLYHLNNNFYEISGYYQYTPDEEGNIKEISEWNPSIAKDFASLLSMYKNYKVAHVYSVNAEEGALWQPSPEELKYTKERVLNKGYANLYDGYWKEAVADYIPSISHRYEYILGKDITISSEDYAFEVGKDEDGNDVVAATHLTTSMDTELFLNYSDMFRILYRAVGQDIVTYSRVDSFDSRIVAETSPASVGLSNIDTLEGYRVYVAVHRNNGQSTGKDANGNTVTYVNDKYLQRAIRDGLIGQMTHEEAVTTYPTYAEVWYYASKLMQRYGEPEMNSTEVHSLLQLYGSYYPIQEGIQVADSWAYLKARGILVTNNVSYECVDVSTFLDIAMRIKDKDSRVSYKDIQLVVNLDQTVVDNGYFPVFGNRLQVVDSYSNKISYSYDVDSYDILVQYGNGTEEFFVLNLQGEEEKPCPEIKVKPFSTKDIEGKVTDYIHLTIPYSFTDTSGLVLKKVTTDSSKSEVVCKIPNSKMVGGILQLVGAEVGDAVSFDSMANANDFVSFVDNKRSHRTAFFTWASYDKNLGEKIAFFFKYIFTPTEVYADTELSPAGNGNGSAGIEMSKRLGRQDLRVASLYALYPIMKFKQNERIFNASNTTGSTFSYESYEDFKGSKSNPGCIPYVSGYGSDALITEKYDMVYVGTEVHTFSKGYIPIWNISDWQDWTSCRKRVVSVALEIAKGFVNSNASYSYAYGGDSNWSQSDKDKVYNIMDKILPYILTNGLEYEIVNFSQHEVEVKTTSKWLYNVLADAENINAINQDDGSTLWNASDPDILAVVEEAKSTGFEGVVSAIPEARQLYADTIMSKRNDVFIAYSALVEAGLTVSSTPPIIDKEGVLSFYLKDVGQVVIDTINKEVAINAVFIKLGDAAPIYKAGRETYINYRCLVGSTINRKISETKVENVPTSSGTGATAKYQLVTRLDKLSKDLAVTSNYPYIGVEQFYNNDFGNLDGVVGRVLTEYAGIKPKSDLVMLNGTFPLANWMIVEDDLQSYLYVFYQRGMFDTTWNSDAKNTACWNDDDCISNRIARLDPKVTGNPIESYNWSIDTELMKAWELEKSALTRLTVNNNLVYNKLEEIYKFSGEDALNSHGILRSTVFSLLSLAEETGVLIENEHYLARRYVIPKHDDLTTIDELTIGMVYDIPTLGYVYVAPTTYNHEMYISGEYLLPIVKHDMGVGTYLIDYNMNIYGNTSVEDGSPTTYIPYGATIVEKQASASDAPHMEVVWCIPEAEALYTTGTNAVVSGDIVKYYTPALKDKAGCFIAAPVGVFKHIAPTANDYVWVNTLNKYTTSACSFYLGSRRLTFKDSDSATKTFSFIGANLDKSAEILSVLGDTEKALVTTRDYYGRHHFVLSPNTNVSGSISINVVDANQYAIDYSDNPIYSGIKAWITSLDGIAAVLLYILFYIMPMIMLLWILVLLAMALISPKLVLGVGRIVGVDLVSIFTLGRRTTQEWKGVRVVAPLIVAFVAMGLFYGPNLLRLIEIVTDFAYRLAGLK